VRCLWITRDFPYPATAGDLIYTARLSEALAAEGAQVRGMSRKRPAESRELDTPSASTGVSWDVVDAPLRSKAGAFATGLPSIAYRYSQRRMRTALDELLRQQWDVVLLDSVAVGWALPAVQRHRARFPGVRVVYISHNHEASVRTAVARNARPRDRPLLTLDAAKVAPLERRLISAADLVTVNTPEDEKAYRSEFPGTRYLVLMPGYLYRVVPDRTIDATLPRRAVIVGAFDWIAKRINLEEFVSAADPRFAAAGAELVVVGRGPEDWLTAMRAKTTATRFTGLVDSVSSYLDDARVGIVAERSGGGFKHKVLYYVFHRVPVAALDGSIAGVPLEGDKSLINAPTVEDLATRVIAALDDVEMLQRLQVTAFDRCAGRFDWSTRGADLMAALKSL
jgi:glycosyltransferase involved in cell wall biosynthesis